MPLAIEGMLNKSIRDMAKALGVKEADIDVEQFDDEWLGQVQAHGVGFTANVEKKIVCVQCHADGHEGFQEFRGDIPEGIAFSMSQQEVRKLLGKPDAKGDKGVVWDRFDREHYVLHLQNVTGAGSIELITIMTLEAVPG